MKSTVETVPNAIRTTRGNDIALAVIGCTLGSCGLWGVASGTVASGILRDWGMPGESGVATLVNSLIWPVTQLAFSLLTAWLAGLGIGGLWRLTDRTPAIRADGTGVHFHPSLYPGLAPWKNVSSIRLTDNSPREIEIRLTERFWSTLAWATGRKVHLNLIALGLAGDEAARWVEAQQKWLHLRGKTRPPRRRRLP